jgi:hypothetical protein
VSLGFKDVYPDPCSPTGSVLAFGMVAEECYSVTSPGQCPSHKHAPCFCTEPIFWNKVAKRSLEGYYVKLNAVAHESYVDM